MIAGVVPHDTQVHGRVPQQDAAAAQRSVDHESQQGAAACLQHTRMALCLAISVHTRMVLCMAILELGAMVVCLAICLMMHDLFATPRAVV